MKCLEWVITIESRLAIAQGQQRVTRKLAQGSLLGDNESALESERGSGYMTANLLENQFVVKTSEG